MCKTCTCKPKTTLNKDEFCNILDLIEQQDLFTRKVEKAFELLNTSYTVFELDTFTRKALYKTLTHLFNKDVVDWVDWYLYESSNKLVNYKDVEYILDTKEKLYDFLFEANI